MHRVRVDKHVQRFHPRFPQDLVGAAAQNHAGSFLGEVENDGLLHVMDGILRVGEGRV